MRTHVYRLPLLLAMAALAGTADGAAAQIERPDPERSFCWTGRPAESCRAFLVAEGNAYAALAGSTYQRTAYSGPDTRSRHMAPHIAWEVGAMLNVSPRDAVGATLLAGGDANGERVALKARYRRWMGPRAALDVSSGALFARRAEPHADPDQPGNVHVPVTGITGDVSLGLTDWAGVSIRGDLLFDRDGERASALYGGLKLGTRPAAVATVLPLIFALGAALVVGTGG